MRIAKVNNFNKDRKVNDKQDINYNYSHLFDNSNEGICIIDNHGYVQYVNSAYEKLFFVEGEGIIGKSIFMTRNDDVILTSFREKKNITGKLDFYIGRSQIHASASLIYNNNKFNGVITIYSQSKTKDNDNMIDIGSRLPHTSSNNNCDYNLNKSFNSIIGESEVMMKALYRAQKSSITSSTVLIRGESGTGKELVAKAIHKSSKRFKEAFVTINCGAIPSTLLESELFGHEQGSFTGAVKRKIGKFELADNGTIFLDEVGDLPLDMQVKLLRVLQEKEIQRVGSNEVISVDARIIAATNRDLERMVEEDQFREDLYYRLNVIPIYLPALRERKEDLPLLIDHFIEKVANKIGRTNITLTSAAKECLYKYDWNGNVRELENVIERLVALSDNDLVDISDMPRNISNLFMVNNLSLSMTGNSLINMNNEGELATMEDYEKEIIKYAIKRFGSFNAAGKALGITHKTVASKARKYNIVE